MVYIFYFNFGSLTANQLIFKYVFCLISARFFAVCFDWTGIYRQGDIMRLYNSGDAQSSLFLDSFVSQVGSFLSIKLFMVLFYGAGFAYFALINFSQFCSKNLMGVFIIQNDKYIFVGCCPFSPPLKSMSYRRKN